MDGFPYSVLNLLMVLVRHHFPKLNCDRMMKVSNGERMAAAKPKLGSVWLRIQLSIQYPLRWSGGWLIQVVDDWSGSHYQNGLALFFGGSFFRAALLRLHVHGRVVSGRGICRVACPSSFPMCPIGLDLKPLANCFFMFFLLNKSVITAGFSTAECMFI